MTKTITINTQPITTAHMEEARRTFKLLSHAGSPIPGTNPTSSYLLLQRLWKDSKLSDACVEEEIDNVINALTCEILQLKDLKESVKYFKKEKRSKR